MGSLSKCLAKNQFMAEDDIAEVSRLYDANVAEGMSQSEAEMAAAREVLADLERVRESILQQIETASPGLALEEEPAVDEAVSEEAPDAVQTGAPVAAADPEPVSEPKITDDTRRRFAEVLATTTPRSKWAEASGVDPETLNTLINEAVSDGRMEIRFGKPVRTAAARVAAPRAEQSAAGQSQQPQAASSQRPTGAAPAMLRSEEQRLERIKSPAAYRQAAALFGGRSSPESFQAALDAVKADKKVKNADLGKIIQAFTGRRTKPKNRQNAIDILDQAYKAWSIKQGKRNAKSGELGQGTGSVSEGSVPAEVRPNEEGRDTQGASGSSGGRRPGDVGRDDRGDAQQSEPAGDVQGAGTSTGSDTGTSSRDDQSRSDTRPTVAAYEPTEEDRAILAADLAEEQAEAERARQERLASNYRITEDDKVGQGGAKQKVRGNIAAIEILKTIEEENRPATNEEKAILVKYVGWGAFSQVAFRDTNQDFAKERAQLKSLMTADEYRSAKESTINAHYTSPDVIKGMWTALEHLGFKGGRVIEPAAGIGHFIGLQPEHLAGNSSWTAVELDTLSGRITKALYGASDVRIGGFEAQVWPNDHFDLAISNVPFAATGPYDPAYKTKLSLHDYFFVKALDKVRPGGIVAFITSSYSLDKTRDAARKEMESRGTFIGAIRLPGGNKGAFKANAGTDVTTDIIFFRKRMQGEPVDINAEWRGLETVKTPEGDTDINAYFVKNPDMMLGKMRLIGSMYSKGEPVLIGPTDNIDQRISDAAAKGMLADQMVERGTMVAPVEDIDTSASGSIKEGAFYLKDGKVYRKIVGVGVPQKLNKQDASRVKAFLPMRDTLNEMLLKQAAGTTDGMADLRATLSAAYDAFVSEFGPINTANITSYERKRDGKTITTKRSPNFSAIEDDTDAWKVSAIELYDEKTGTAKKAAIFTEDIVAPYVRPAITGPADALTVSLNETGRVDMKLIAEQLGTSERRAAETLGEQVYLNPKGEQWQTATQYLAGDVVTKLADAKAASELDSKYARNVEALEAVQPVPLSRAEITIPFGASYVPEDVLNAFIKETVGVEANVSLNPGTKSWNVRLGYSSNSGGANVEWGTKDFKPVEIIEAALNSKPLMVQWKDREGVTHRDLEGEAEARAKVTLLKEAFTGQIYPGAQAAVGGWVWNDEARAQRLEALYNQAMNRIVKETHDGSHLTFPGLARVVSFPDGSTGTINLTPARVGAIARIIQNGNTLIDHVVGAGKTWTSIMAVMEMKRLGQIRRPMFVVPNHMLMQFSNEFLQAYPGAKLLVATKDNMSRDRRAEFAAKAAAEKWDGIIITHSAFGRLKMQDKAYTEYYEDVIAQLEAAKAGEDDATVKDIVKAVKSVRKKLDTLIKKEKKDQGVTFEELGVDHLTVDEAHLFKNLWFKTRHTRIKGISNSSESQRATDLFIKIRHLEKSRPGRSALFLTGTPLSNTMAEVYTMMRYLQHDTLAEYDISEFDSWAQTFGVIDTQTELAPNGRDFRDTTSFSKFVNIPELSGLYARIADTQTAESLGLKRPNLKGGRPQVIDSELSVDEDQLIQAIITKMESLKGAKPEKGAPNFLSLFTKGLQASTDPRLVDPSFPYNPDGKIGKAVGKIFEIWEQGNKDPKAPDKAQLVFLDMGVPGSRTKSKAVDLSVPDRTTGNVIDTEETLDAIRKDLAGLDDTADDESEIQAEASEDDAEVDGMLFGKFNLYENIKNLLIERGVPAEQIAFIHDAKNDDAKAKMFEAVREGQVRVLLGSSGKMGVGTNVQKRLIALHHIDAPWKPADLEQRDGRILRQGNKNEEIQIYRYITKKSFESYRWQILEKKANFIAQFRAGARGLRIAEDIDSPLPDASEIKAAATGDSRIVELAELDRTVRGLLAQASAHANVSVRARSSLVQVKGDIDRISKRIATYEEDAARVVDLSGDKFAITANLPGGKTATFKERKKAGEALRGYILKLAELSWYGRETEIEFGTISGFEVSGIVKKTPDGVEVRPAITGTDSYRARNAMLVTEDANPVTLVQQYERVVAGVPGLLADARLTLEQSQSQIPGLEAKVNGTPFPKQDELLAAQKRLEELQNDLKPKKQAEVVPGSDEDLATREAAARARMAQDDYARASDMETGFDTSKVPGFWSENWKADRRYNLPIGEATFEEAVDYLFKQAIDKAEANGGVAKERKAFIVIGFGGAGKSTLANPLARERKAVHASADDAKLIIPEFDGGKNSGGVHEESSELGKVVLRRLIEGGYNVVLEKLGSNTESIGRPINQFKAAGYSPNLLYVRVPKAVAMERAISRFEGEGRAIAVGTYDLNIDEIFTTSSAKGDVGYGTFEWQDPDGWKWGEVNAPDLGGLVITDRFTGKPIAIGGDGAARNDALGGSGRRQVLDQDGAGSAQGTAERRLTPPQGVDPEQWVRDTLTSYGIDPARFGTGVAKPLNNLVNEVVKGEAELIDRNGQLVRRVSPLALDIFADVDGKSMWLTEDRQVFSDGRERRRGLAQSIGEKLEPGEDPQDSVARALEEELGITKFRQLSEIEQITQPAMESPSYPGLMSEYTTYKTAVLIDPADYKPEYEEKQKDKTNYFVWQERSAASQPVSVSDFAKSVADLKAKVSKEQPRSKLIQDDVVDIEEVSLSIREFLPAVAEPVEGGRLPKVQEATQTFVAGLADVVTVARQQETVDTTNATYDDLDVFTDALDDLDSIIEDKLQEGYEVDEELSDYESSLTDAIDEIESEYETLSSDAETEFGYLNDIWEGISDRLPEEPETDEGTGTAVSTDVKRVMDDLPEWTGNKNLIDEARQEIAWLKEKWQPVYDRGNEAWGVDTDEMTDAELIAYAKEVEDISDEMVRFKWHADFMVKQVAEKGRPSIEAALEVLRDEVLKPTMDELTDLQIALQARRNAEVERMNTMNEDVDDEGDVTASLAAQEPAFAEAAMPSDVGANARTVALAAPLRVHARALFAAGLDQDALNKAITALEKDRSLAPKDRAAVAEAYVGGYVNPKVPSREIRKAFAERVHDVSLAEISGFDPSISGSNLAIDDDAVTERLQQLAARLPEGAKLAIRDVLEIAMNGARSVRGVALEGGAFSPEQASRYLGINPGPAKKLMAISLAYGPDVALSTFTHEEIHILRQMGLFTDQEWKHLSGLAARKPSKKEATRIVDALEASEKIDGRMADEMRAKAGSLTYRQIYAIDERYSRIGATEEQMIEEVVAHVAADWADGHDFGSRIERVMMKIRDFIEALKSMLNGAGFENVESIFQSVWSGEVAKRAVAESASEAEAAYKLADYFMSTSIDALADRVGATSILKLRPWSKHPGRVLAFHGTEAQFDTFDLSATQDFGLHFGTTDQANKFAEGRSGFRKSRAKEGESGRVIPVVLDLTRVLDLKDLGDWRPMLMKAELARSGFRMSGPAVAQFDRAAQLSDHEPAYRILREELTRQGYDGIRYLNDAEGKGVTWSYIVWEKGHVESATAGDTMFSLAGDQEGAQLNTAIQNLKDALGIQVSQTLFGVTIKAGNRSFRINPRANVRGQTSRATGSVATRRSRDMQAIAHEGGHSLELMLGQTLDATKATFATELTAPFAPDVPMPKLAEQGFSGLELDAFEQQILLEAVRTDLELRRLATLVGNEKSKPRLVGKPQYDKQAYEKAQIDAARARAQLVRIVGEQRANGLVDDVIKAQGKQTPAADVQQYIKERFAAMADPRPRQTAIPEGDALSEGFARWFEKYVMDRAGAETMAPKFFEAFEDLLEAEAPSVLEGLHTVQEQYKPWTKRATVEELSSDVVSVESQNDWASIRDGKKGFTDTITGQLASSYAATIDDLSPIQQVVRRLLSVADRNQVTDDQGRPISLKVSENPYKIARMFRGSYATGYTWLKDGIPNYGKTTVAFPGLQMAMETIFGGNDWDAPTYKAFGQYLISKRAIAEYQRLDEKKSRLANLDDLVQQGGDVWRKINVEQSKARETLARRQAALDRSNTLLRDRTSALKSAKTEERKVQERMQELRDDLAEAMRAIDDGSDVARSTRDRKRRSLQLAERNAREARNRVVELDADVFDRDTDVSMLLAEIEQLRAKVDQRQVQLDQLTESVTRLRRERDVTSKRGASRPPTLEPKEWHDDFVNKVETKAQYAKFAEAAEIVYGFTHGLLTIRWQAGLISDQLYAELSNRKAWYVPFMRDMTDAPAETVFSGSSGKSWSPFKKFDGSDRSILHPLEILSQEAYAAAQHIAMNEAVGALATLATRAGPGSANIAQLMERTEGLENTPETWERIKDIAISMGIDEADAHLIVQRMEMNFANDDLQAIWSPSSKGPIAPPTLPFWEKGERKHVVVSDPEFGHDAVQAMMGLGKEQMGFVLEAFGAPARALQIGVTTHPTFMPRNLIRDIFDAWIKTGALPIVTQVRGAVAMRGKDGFLRNYTAAGGILGGRNIAALSQKEQQADILDLDPNKLRLGSVTLGAIAGGLTGTIVAGPLGGMIGTAIGGYGTRHGGLLKLVESVESMTRLGVAAHAYKRALTHNPDLTEQEAMLEAAFVARDVFDWNRRGSKMLAVVRTITFLNAQIQGLDRAARAIGGSGDRGAVVFKRLQSVYRKEHDIPLSADEQRDLGEAYKVYGRLALYSALLLGLYALYRDDDEYEDIRDKTKATHSWLPNFLGVDVRIPKSFEWALPANFIEILWDKLEGRDPNIGERLMTTVQNVLVPPAVPQAANLLVGWTTNKDLQSIAPWLFGDDADNVNRDIVPEYLKGLAPEQQFDAFTSQLSKDIAVAMAKAGVSENLIPSPKMIDFTLRAGGYWGQDIGRAYQFTKEAAGYPAGPSPRVPDMPVVGGFTGVAARQSKSVDEMFRLMNQSGGDLVQAADTFKGLMDKSGNPAEAESYLARLKPEERAYATLKYYFPTSDQRMHPLERLTAVAKITRDIRKDIVLDRVAPTKKEGRKKVIDFEAKIELTPKEKTTIQDVMERLQQAEAWNAFVAMGRPGWDGKSEMAVGPILDEMKAASPAVYNLFEDRKAAAKVEEFEDVKKSWPAMRDELLRNGADANF